MIVKISIGRFPFFTLVKVTLFMLVIMALVAGVIAIFSTSTAYLITHSWIYMLIFPLCYGLISAISTRHATLCFTNFGNKDEVLNPIDKIMAERGDVASINESKICYRSSKKISRFINAIFDVLVQVEVSENAILVEGNKNILRFILHSINKSNKFDYNSI